MEKELRWVDIEVGDEGVPLEYTITDDMIDSFARAVEDYGDWYIKGSPFGGRIAHPTLTATDWGAMLAPKWGSFSGFHAKHETHFINPALTGKKIRVTGRVVDKYVKRGRNYIEFEYTAVDEDGREIVRHKFITTVD